jgi:hypothetical protein
MLKQILITVGLVLGLIIVLFIIASSLHFADTELYSKLTQCHSQNGVLVEEVQTQNQICLSRDKTGGYK